MIHYSVMPPELVFQGFFRQEPPLREVAVGGVQMLVRMERTGEATIVRLLSPDPRHYLDPRFQPGNRLKMGPQV
jgi:hypothetical protein